jgi:hypothetical protein
MRLEKHSELKHKKALSVAKNVREMWQQKQVGITGLNVIDP